MKKIVYMILLWIIMAIVAFAFQFGGPWGISPIYPDSWASWLLMLFCLVYFIVIIVEIRKYYALRKWRGY